MFVLECCGWNKDAWGLAEALLVTGFATLWLLCNSWWYGAEEILRRKIMQYWWNIVFHLVVLIWSIGMIREWFRVRFRVSWTKGLKNSSSDHGAVEMIAILISWFGGLMRYTGCFVEVGVLISGVVMSWERWKGFVGLQEQSSFLRGNVGVT